MVKKRGGRRGKAPKAPDDQPPKPEIGPENAPGTSQSNQKAPPSQSDVTVVKQTKGGPEKAQSLPQGRSRKPTEEDVTSAWGRGPSIIEDQPNPKTEQFQHLPQNRGKVRSLGEDSRSDLGRGQSEAKEKVQGRGRPTEEEPKSVWGRGRGQSPFEATRPGAAPEQGWGGVKPKETSILKQIPKELASEASRGPKGTAETLTSSSQSLTQIEKQIPIKSGTLGRRIKIETNHFELNLGNLRKVHRYDVNIQPEKKPKRMYRQAMRLFQLVHFPNNHPSYDGQKLLFSAKILPLQNDFISGLVTIELSEGRQQEFEITIKLSGTLDLSPLHNLLQKKNIGLEEAFQCVEVVFRQAYVSSFITVGRRFYIPGGNAYPLGSGAEMYLGGYQAAVKGSKPFLNVDVAHKGFTTSISIINLVIDMFSTRYKRVTDQELARNLQSWQFKQLSEYLKGLKIVYEIPNHPGSRKVYKVNGFASANETFEHDGRSTTVKNYFSTKWRYNLRYPNLDTLWIGNDKKRICVPMECCRLQEGQPVDGGRMTSSQTAAMINYSATPTTERKKKIQDVLETAGHNKDPCIQEFGFSIGNEFQRLDARVLDPPILEYCNGVVEPKYGVWRGKKFKIGANIQKWTVVGVEVDRERVGNDINQLAKKIAAFGSSSGMRFPPAIEPFTFIRSNFQSLQSYLETKKSFDFVLVVIPPKNEVYHLVKQVAELQVGCLTQCIKSTTLTKLSDSTIGNILLKINTKTNGTSHTLLSLDLISKEPCMVMGADVTHPSPQATMIPSVVAVTASYDLTATKYNISVELQEPRTSMSEMIQNLQAITVQKLKIFFEKTKKDPVKLFFFRDGVSDGEFERVKQVEVAAILKACEVYKRGYRPKLTFLVVQKRHHTRFFPTDQSSSGGDRNFNVPPGTCVDSVITDPTIQNYYLVSHASIRGVARPTKYCVLFDENGLSSDDIQMLTYYLCHVFSRCNRAVSYPAPTYYAHLVADRAKGYLHGKNVDINNLNQKLVQIKEQFAAQNPMFFS